MFTITAASQKNYVFVGTYTDEGSEGIYVYDFDQSLEKLNLLFHTTGIINPSFFTISEDKKHLYAIQETANGQIHCFTIDTSSQTLTLLNSVPIPGNGPCYVALDKTGKWCMIANYGSGSICTVSILPDGSLGPIVQNILHENILPYAKRDGKPHAHAINIAPNNKDVFVSDLGVDKIIHYILDDKNGWLTQAKIPFVQTGEGSGPRHFTFHPNYKYAYSINELNSTIDVFHYHKKNLSHIQRISTLPKEFSGINYCADIHISPDGLFLYGSNRGHNSLAIYAIDGKTGKLQFLGTESVRGNFPRNFAITPSGEYVLVANQKSNNIQLFKRNINTGLLTYLDKEIKISKPVCIKFLKG